MVRFSHFHIPTVALILYAALSVSVAAQTAADEAGVGHAKSRLVPRAVSPAPFSADGSTRETALSVEFRDADKMTEKDRLLAADAESSIAEHAGTNGFA